MIIEVSYEDGPFKFLTNYGKKKQHDQKLGFSLKNIFACLSLRLWEPVQTLRAC